MKSSSTQFSSYSRRLVYTAPQSAYHAPPDTQTEKYKEKINLCETRTWSVVSFSHSAVLSLSLSKSNWIQPASYSNEFALFSATDRFHC